MSTAIEFNHVSKQYRLGLVSTRTLGADLNRWWTMNIRGKEDPYLKIGSVNDRSTKADNDFVWALRDIDFKVEQGDVVGIIGKNGAGKSTLLKLLSKVTGPTTGSIKARGRIGSLLEVGTGFHPEMTGRENIFMNGAILGMTKQEIAAKLDEIIDFSGCERYLDTPVKRYSSGMTVRLGFAVAAFLEPEILVVDEVLAVGDAEFQKKAIGKMRNISEGEGRTVLFVSHNMASIEKLCNHGVMLENGMIKKTGNVHDVVEYYLQDQIKNKNFLREGNGFIRFEDYWLERNVIEIGDNLEVHISIRANEYVDSCMLHINIYSSNGQYVAQSISDDDTTFELKKIESNKEYKIKCLLPYLNVIPGHYLINLWIGTAYEWFDWIKECMRFSVRQEGKFINRLTPYPSDAKIVLQSHWTYE
ncbi:MAG: ABC transporter ATP-binding protein [Bacteroidaceae bacterium]|nr:ABC transporter ATP-binding protein [Bacteroidaceae bacterium]